MFNPGSDRDHALQPNTLRWRKELDEVEAVRFKPPSMARALCLAWIRDSRGSYVAGSIGGWDETFPAIGTGGTGIGCGGEGSGCGSGIGGDGGFGAGPCCASMFTVTPPRRRRNNIRTNMTGIPYPG